MRKLLKCRRPLYWMYQNAQLLWLVVSVCFLVFLIFPLIVSCCLPFMAINVPKMPLCYFEFTKIWEPSLSEIIYTKKEPMRLWGASFIKLLMLCYNQCSYIFITLASGVNSIKLRLSEVWSRDKLGIAM